MKTTTGCQGGGYLNVYISQQTQIIGPAPAVGYTASATGTGSCTTSVQATLVIVTPSAGSMTHALTSAYLGGKYGPSMNWAQAAPYLSWAETDAADATAIHNAGISTLVYIDPNRTAPGNPLYTSDDTTFAHDCYNNRIYDTHDNATVWVMDPSSTSLQSLYAQYVTYELKQGHFDAIFQDESGALSAYAPYDPFYPGMPCNYTDSGWIQGEIALGQAPSLPVIFNGLDGLNGHNPSLSVGMLAGSNTIGGNYESCYSTYFDLKEDGWAWQAVENTELQVQAYPGKYFFCMVKNTGQASSQIDARIYAEASFLLTYSPSQSVYWTFFSTASGFTVMPESELVAASPSKPTPKSIASLKQSGGTYAREYTQCYLAGVSVGPCAAVVNSDRRTSHPFPFSTYQHTLALSGDGVLDGGTISTSGPPPPSTLPPLEAEIVFP